MKTMMTMMSGTATRTLQRTAPLRTATRSMATAEEMAAKVAGEAAKTKSNKDARTWKILEDDDEGACFQAGDTRPDPYDGPVSFGEDDLAGVAGLSREEQSGLKYDDDYMVAFDDHEAMDAAFWESVRENPLTFVRPGMRIKTKYVSTYSGGAFYDYGIGDIVTPRPLHTGITSADGVPTASALRSASKSGSSNGEGEEHEAFIGTIDLPMEVSDLMLYEGQYLPAFSKSGSTGSSSGANPIALTWDALEDAYRQKRPVQARVLNAMNGGFAVAVGSVVAFMPNSHVSPFLKGPASKQWEARTKSMVGEAIWVQVLTLQRDENNLVVSHRTLPRHLLLPMLAESRSSSPRRRTGPVPVPTIPAVEQKLAEKDYPRSDERDKN